MNKKLLALVMVFGILASACELRADLRLELNADQSGRVLVSFGLDEEFQALVESGGESVEDSLFGEDNPFGELPGAEQRTYVEEDFTYYEASVPFEDLNGLRRLGDQDEAENIVDEFDIRFTEDTATVTGSFELGEITGGDLADDELAGIGAEALAQFFKLRIQIAMPGEVETSNADRVLDDGTLEWDIPLTGSVDTLAVEARSSLSGGGGFPAWIAALAAIIVVGALVFFVTRSRSRSTSSATPEHEDLPSPIVTEVPEVASEGDTEPTEG